MLRVHFRQRSFDWVGWCPIYHMSRLAADLLDATLIVHESERRNSLRRYRHALIPPPRGGSDTDLFISRKPGELNMLIDDPCFTERRRARAIWFIDSFETHTLRPWRLLDRFDLVAFTREEDAGEYTRLLGDRAVHLPWGSDVLGHGSAREDRTIDLLRVGRQPAELEDDDANGQAVATGGLTYHGRPPKPESTGDYMADGQAAYADIMQWYGEARFILAYCNLHAPSYYTHADRSYLTGRWTDALAAGASVVGIPPLSDVDLVNWPGALVRTTDTSVGALMEALTEARGVWTPAQVHRNHSEALRRLDWRHRFAVLADRLDLPAPKLRAALDEIAQRPSPPSRASQAGLHPQTDNG